MIRPVLERTNDDGIHAYSAHSDYLWCLHCERTFRADKRANRKTITGRLAQSCAYKGCSGGPTDFWDWAFLRKVNPEYPEVPEPGKLYPQYGFDDVAQYGPDEVTP